MEAMGSSGDKKLASLKEKEAASIEFLKDCEITKTKVFEKCRRLLNNVLEDAKNAEITRTENIKNSLFSILDIQKTNCETTSSSHIRSIDSLLALDAFSNSSEFERLFKDIEVAVTMESLGVPIVSGRVGVKKGYDTAGWVQQFFILPKDSTKFYSFESEQVFNFNC